MNSYDYDNEAKYPNIYDIPPGMLKGRDLSQVTSALNSLIKNFYGSLEKMIEKFQKFYKEGVLKRDLLLMIYSSLTLKKIIQLRSKFLGERNFGNHSINQVTKNKKYNQFNLSLLESLGKLLAQFLDFYSYSNKIIKNKYSNDFKFLNWFMNNIHSQDQPHISDTQRKLENKINLIDGKELDDLMKVYDGLNAWENLCIKFFVDGYLKDYPRDVKSVDWNVLDIAEIKDNEDNPAHIVDNPIKVPLLLFAIRRAINEFDYEVKYRPKNVLIPLLGLIELFLKFIIL